MKNHLLSIIKIDGLSKHRTELMGIGILGVMLGHYLEWSQVIGYWSYLFKPFIGLVFTEGFLILSGFGLVLEIAVVNDESGMFFSCF